MAGVDARAGTQNFIRKACNKSNALSKNQEQETGNGQVIGKQRKLGMARVKNQKDQNQNIRIAKYTSWISTGNKGTEHILHNDVVVRKSLNNVVVTEYRCR